MIVGFAAHRDRKVESVYLPWHFHLWIQSFSLWHWRYEIEVQSSTVVTTTKISVAWQYSRLPLWPSVSTSDAVHWLTYSGDALAHIWRHSQWWCHKVRYYNDVITGAIASQITSLTIVFSTFYSDADRRKYQTSPVTGEFPAQMASNAENVSIQWRHRMAVDLLPVHWRHQLAYLFRCVDSFLWRCSSWHNYPEIIKLCSMEKYWHIWVSLNHASI